MGFQKSAALASFSLLAISAFTIPAANASTAPYYRDVEVAFVLDTTGSMSGLIDGAKQKIWSIANEIMDNGQQGQVNVQFALIGFRDRGDAYVTKTFNLTSDMHGIYGHLLDLRARGGGDRPESVNQALYEAVSDLDWSKSSRTLKLVFLVGDSPPHMNYSDDVPYPATIRIANGQNIVINTVQAGSSSDTARIWRDIARLGQGDYVAIPQSGGMQVIHSPYDEEINNLQRQINQTSLGYGSAKAQMGYREKRDRVSSAPASVASDMAEYRLKAGKKNQVITGAKELVEDYEDGKVTLSDIPKEELPKSLQTLPPAVQKDRLDSLVAKRHSLNSKMEKLVKDRDSYIAAEREKLSRKNGEDSFDAHVETIVSEQMSRKPKE